MKIPTKNEIIESLQIERHLKHKYTRKNPLRGFCLAPPGGDHDEIVTKKCDKITKTWTEPQTSVTI